MYRQATGMESSDVHVFARRYLNTDQFPFPHVNVPPAEVTRLPKSLLRRAGTYAANWRVGFFRGSPGEVAWWRGHAQSGPPGVALCQYGPTAVRMLPLFRSLGIPIVAHFHGYDLPIDIQDKSYRSGLEKALPHLAGMVVVAPHMKEWLLAHGVDESRIRLIPCGVPIADFVPSRVDHDPCQFAMVGRLVEKKRPDLTLRAFARCLAECPGVRLAVAGDGPMMAECQALASELGIAGKVDFRGVATADQIKQLLSDASVFVQHSVTASNGDMEGWPVAIAEAAASGLPIVATRHASIPQQVLQGTTGMLADEGDWQTMAEHMIQLAKDPELRRDMGIAAREHISAYDTTRQVAQLETFLHEVAAARAKT
jgi:glycosyltransferase involved in cell wall biosynthesis